MSPIAMLSAQLNNESQIYLFALTFATKLHLLLASFLLNYTRKRISKIILVMVVLYLCIC